MDRFFKLVSFIFHPIIVPILGVTFYYFKTPRFVSDDVIQAKIISLSILTIILPILLYFLLKTLGKVQSIYLNTAKERILPLAVNFIIILIILKRILLPSRDNELYYFFLGILISTLACLILALFKVKASMHMMGIAGLFMFFIALSIHFSININGTLALMAIITGLIATARLHLQAHNTKELLLGLFVGFLPQLTLINYWL